MDGSLASLAMHYFDAAFDQSPLGMALYSTDGHFVRVNDAMSAMLGAAARSCWACATRS